MSKERLVSDAELVEAVRALQNGKRVPQWAARLAFGLIMVLTAVVWAYLGASIAAKADESEVEELAQKIVTIEQDIDYLARKAEADQVNDVITRRVLDDLARANNITPGGKLVQPRPAEHKHE
jgi:outer membrane murein-binding lipoprotein Lpp